MIRTFIALLRAARLALHIGHGLTLAVAYPWFPAALRRRILQRWSAALLAIFNVRVELTPEAALHNLRSGLIVTNHISWLDVFVLNAPYNGGTHLPDITVIVPVFHGDEDEPSAFVAARGHHADIGGIATVLRTTS